MAHARFRMKVNRRSTRYLLHFYLTKVPPNDRSAWYGSSVMWTVIFVERFGELPNDPVPQTGRFMQGSTDPRWDVLLHEEQMLRAQKIVLRYLRRTENHVPKTHLITEAA